MIFEMGVIIYGLVTKGAYQDGSKGLEALNIWNLKKNKETHINLFADKDGYIINIFKRYKDLHIFPSVSHKLILPLLDNGKMD